MGAFVTAGSLIPSHSNIGTTSPSIVAICNALYDIRAYLLTNVAAPPSYGSLFENNNSGTALTLTTAGTWYQWSTSSVGIASGAGYIVASATNDNLTIGASGAGKYLIIAGASFHGTNNHQYDVALHHNNSPNTSLEFDHKMSGASDVETGAFAAMLTLVANDTLDLRFSSNFSSDSIVIHHAHISAVRISL